MRPLIYQRYLAESIIPPLIVMALLISSIIWISQALRYINLLDKGIGFFNFLGLIILIFPSLLFITLPFITLFAIMYAYYNLSEERQLITLKNSSISNIKLAIPAFCVALFITIFSYYISFDLMPRSYNNLRNEISYLQDNYISKIINEKEFTQVANGVVLYIASKSPNDILEGIVLFDERQSIHTNKNNTTIFFAKEGEFSFVNKKIILELKNGYRQSYDTNNNLTRLYFDNLVVQLKNASDVDIKNSRSRGFREFYVKELLEHSASCNGNELNKNKYLTEAHQRIIWPFFTILLPFFALSIWFKSSYNRESNLNIIYIIVTLVILISYLHFTFLNMAVSNIKYIYLCYVNILCCGIIGVILFFITDNEISRFKKIYRLFRN